MAAVAGRNVRRMFLRCDFWDRHGRDDKTLRVGTLLPIKFHKRFEFDPSIQLTVILWMYKVRAGFRL